jgi:hypothetical protein
MADDFYNQNIGPLKGSYFGPGVGGSESQRRFSDYYTKSINPVRESIKETEERKMKAEKARQDIEAENERRKKAAKEAELEIAAQEKVDGAFGKLDTIRQTEDPVERQALLNKFKSSLSIADRQVSEIKAGIDLVQTGIDESEGETKTQREAQDSSREARVNLLISEGRFKQARDVAKKISDPTKKKKALTTIVDKKPSATEGLKQDFAEMTKTATSALSALSKITPSSVAPENQGDSRSSITLSRRAKEAMEAAEKRAREENLSEKEIEEAIDKARAEYTEMDPDIEGGEKPTDSNNLQIYRAARNAYFTLFGAEEADKLFKDDPDNMTPKELSDLFDAATKKVAELKSKSRSNKNFFRRFVPGEGVLPLPEKPKKTNPEGTGTFGGPGFGGK